MRVNVTNKPNDNGPSIADLVTAPHDIWPDQCVSWICNLTQRSVHRCSRIQNTMPPLCPTYQMLEPGRSFSVPLIFAKTGSVRLIVEANILSGTTVELAVLDVQGREIWRTLSSTRTAGSYVVDLETPGDYELRVINPSSEEPLAILLNITACGDPAVEFWLMRYIKHVIMEVTRELVQQRRMWPDETRTIYDHGNIHVAPMGIAVYGVKKDGERYSTYKLVTNAVRGVIDISPDILALGYFEDGTYYGQALSVQLNAVVAAKINDKEMQYYWTQNVTRFGEVDISGEYITFDELEILNNILDITTVTPTLNESKVKGRGNYSKRGYVYYTSDTVPLGRVELETWVRVKNGEIIVEFYANGQKYDEATITPRAPATSAHIVVAPTTTPVGAPLDLELVLGGFREFIPFTVLKRGRIRLELYVRENGEWVPPPSAWSIGNITYECSHARVIPQGVGSALVVPGEPNLEQLWP